VELKLENKTGEIRLIGNTGLHLKKESLNEVVFFIVLDKKDIHQHKTPLEIGVYKAGEKIQTVHTNSLGPFI
jgi:hypothetical protein